MKSYKYVCILLVLLAFSQKSHAQYITVDESKTPQQLVTDVLINNPCLIASNITVSGMNFGSGDSYGYFTSGTAPSFPFSDGILLTTGRASDAIGPNTSILSQGPSSWAGDSDLEQALNLGGSFNATILEFDVVPLTNQISFDYVFASEQYLLNPNPNQCGYTDGFVFLIKEVGSADPYYNMAIVPGTNLPVTVTNVRGPIPSGVCPAKNETWFDAFNGTQHPTNYNGQTKILTAKATVTPGATYHLKLAIADQGNHQYDSAIFLGGGSFRSDKDLGPDRLRATGNPICYGYQLTLDATEPGTGNTYTWYRNGTAVANTPEYIITQDGSYRVEIALNGSTCTSEGTINIEFADPLTLTPVTLVQCDVDNDGVTTFNLNKANDLISATDPSLSSPTYYASMTDANPITNPSAYVTSATTVYALVQNPFGCKAFLDVNLTISNNTITPPPPVTVCDAPDAAGGNDQDGRYVFDLAAEVTPAITAGIPSGLNLAYYATEQDALTGTNQLGNIFENTTPFSQVIYALVTNGPDCYGIIPVTLQVRIFDDSNLPNATVPLCDGENVTLSAAAGYALYSWNDPENTRSQNLTVTTPGTYVVTITNADGCVQTQTFTVTLSGVATINSVSVDDFRGSGNTVTISAGGPGVYEYSLDGIDYQESPVFTNVEQGVYTIYVNDTKGCGPPATETVYVLDYPKFFSPNGDGINDYWRIPNLQFLSQARIDIFDRYGQLIHSFASFDQGWTGTVNGNPMPASDYWFVISLFNGRTIRGHFSLTR